MLNCSTTYLLPVLVLLLFTGCRHETENGALIAGAYDSSSSVLPSVTGDTASSLLNPTLSNRNFSVVLEGIRSNFKKINSASTFTQIKEFELTETQEGGWATFGYLQGQLAKITTEEFGEMFQKLTEYYLLHEKISFVFEKTLKYNRPIFYDSAAMRANEDTEVFDRSKSVTATCGSYFDGRKLIHQINKPSAVDNFGAINKLQEEEARIFTAFEKLLRLSSAK